MNYLFLDNGFEEIEAITTIDLLRRANIALTTVSITGNPMVLGAHNIAVEADGLIERIDFSDAEMLILPGGQTKLGECSALCDLLIEHNKADKLIAAICAAPAVLGKLGILEGKQATCYPGFEKALAENGARYTGDLVTVDSNITTAEGPAAAFPYAYELLGQLVDKQTADQIAEGMRFKHLMQK